MQTQSLNMDGDDTSDLIIEVERSFDVRLGKDLSHIVTVGDLHTTIVREMGGASGDSCPTSRTFYRIRLVLGAEEARPETALKSLWAGSPRGLKRHIRHETGWEMPALTIGWFGCVAIILSVAFALFFGWQVSGWTIPPILAAGVALLRLDRGAWLGDWATSGSLARAIAARNYAALATSGARQSPVTAWHALTTLIAGYGIDQNSIKEESGLCG